MQIPIRTWSWTYSPEATWVVFSRRAWPAPRDPHVVGSAAISPTLPYRPSLRKLQDFGQVACNIHFLRWNYGCSDLANKPHILAVAVAPAADLAANKVCSRLQGTADIPGVAAVGYTVPSERNAASDSGPDFDCGYDSASAMWAIMHAESRTTWQLDTI